MVQPARRWGEDTTAATAHGTDGGTGEPPVFALPSWAPLPARPDPDLDRLAAAVAAELGVPMVAVLLVSKAGQVFPGAFGLPEPVATDRSTPLSHSLTQLVATSGRPLVVADAQLEPELADRHTVAVLGIRAWAALPLVDERGRPVGVLSAADDVPRDWRPEELAALQRWAGEASTLLRSRVLRLAEAEARAAAVREDAAARAAADAARVALLDAEAEADRARLVARLSAALLTATDVPDVLRLCDRLVRSPLGGSVAALGVATGGSSDVRVWTTTSGTTPLAGPVATLCLSDDHPLASALRGRRPVVTGLVAGGRAVPADLPGGPYASAVAVPLAIGQHDSAGALLVGWRERRAVDPSVLRVIDDLASHLGHALDRVLLREQRTRLTAPRGG